MTDPIDPATGELDEKEYRRIQRQRSRVTALLLLGFAALTFGITIAKIGIFA